MTELYLYQTLHLYWGEVRLLCEHVARLDAASRRFFGQPYTPDLASLRSRSTTLAAEERYPAGQSAFVRIELTTEGGERLVPAGVSLYSGYALRSLMPEAVVYTYDLPLGDDRTSAREAAAGLARQAALTAGAGAAVRCDTQGRFCTADDAPLFAVRGHTVYAPPATGDVERSLGIRAIRAAGLGLSDAFADRAMLPRLDELFAVDHRGVTSLSRCEGYPLLSLAAERVARALEGLFSHA